MVNKLKIMLVIPNSPSKEESSKYIYVANEDQEGKFEPPLGVLYLAAVLEKRGYEVVVFDNFAKRIPNQELIKLIQKENPDILGLSLFITNYKSAREIMKTIKKTNNKIKIVVGGPYSTLYYDEIIENSDLDFVVFGEGEYTLLEIADKIKNKKLRGKISGCYYRKGSKIIKGPWRPFIENLDSLPFPAWHLVNINDYYRKKTIYLDVAPIDFVCSSRGCPYACSFCSSRDIWKRRYRYRSAKNICDEIEYMIKTYGTKGIHFREDNFTVNRQKVIDFCKEVRKRNLNIKWQCESRVDTLDEELIKIMYNGGCRGMWFGIESGSQEILDQLEKGIKIEQIRKIVDLCYKYKITTGGSFMFGLPIEKRSDIQKTFKFAKSLKLNNVIFNKYVGVPKCYLYDYAKEHGYYREEWEKMLVIETPEFSVEDLDNMQIWFNNYFRLRRIRKVFTMRSIKQYPQIFIRGIKLLKDLIVKKPNLK